MAPAKPFYTAHDYPVGESVGFLVRQLKMSLTRCVDAAMACHGLTDAQWGPLLLIACGGVRTAAALAQALELDAGAMTRTLDRLQAKGLIRRSRSRDDRRIWTLELTPSGARAAAQVPGGLAHANNIHLAGFDRREFQQLRAYLVRMIDNGRHARAAVGATPVAGGERARSSRQRVSIRRPSGAKAGAEPADRSHAGNGGRGGRGTGARPTRARPSRGRRA